MFALLLNSSVSLFLFPSKALQAKSESIGRAADFLPAPIQHMGVEHGGAHVTMAQQLLHRFGPEARNAESRLRLRTLKGQ